MRKKTFKCSKLLLFLKKNQFNLVKNVKNYRKYAIFNISKIIKDFEQFSTFFTMLTWFFGTFKRLMAHLFCFRCFQNLDVDFWPLLKAKKCFPRSNFGGKKNFPLNFLFYHPYESINFQPAGLLKTAFIVTPLLKHLLFLTWCKENVTL